MIKKNVKGESLIGIIIAVSLLGLVIMGIVNLISYSDDINYEYETKSNIDLIKDNSTTIVKKLDITDINEGELFYLYKNTTNKNFEIFTGVLNESYKYIDKNGLKVDIMSFSGEIYERTIILEKKDTSTSNNIFKVDVIKKKY